MSDPRQTIGASPSAARTRRRKGGRLQRLAALLPGKRATTGLAFAYLLFVAGLALAAAALTDTRAQRLLADQSARYSSAWAEFLGNGLEAPASILSGARLSEHDRAFLLAALEVRDIFRFKLFDIEGRQVLVSDDLGGATVVTPANRHTETARRALAEDRAIAEVKDGRAKPDRPAVYVETYVPLKVNGTAIGVAEVYMDQTTAAAHIDSSFLDLGLIAGATMALALIFPVLGLAALLRRLERQNARLHHHRVRAEQAERFKANFIARMSHDLRTPLNSIIGFADMLQSLPEIAGDRARTQEYARLIHRGGRSMLRLVNDILDLSAIEAGKRTRPAEPIHLVSALGDCARDLGPMAAHKDLRLDVAIAPDAPVPVMDPQAFGRVLSNLVTNAIKYSPRGASIRLAARPAPTADEADASTLRAEIAVIDEGPGIAPDRVASITDPFTQAEDDPHVARDGVGLGLAIVKALLDENDGTLAIDSAPGQGTTVRITLPAAEG